MGSLQTISTKKTILKIGVALTATIGGVYSINRLNRINAILGNEVLDEALKQYELLCQDDSDNQKYNKTNGLNNFIERIDISLDIYQKRVRTYLNRFIYYDQYDRANISFVQNVARPILAQYEAQKIFELKELITQLKTQGNFNNKLTAQLMQIVTLNSKLKEKNQYYINDLVLLQQKLITIAIPALSPSQKEKIDLIYEYIKAKNSNLSAIASKIIQQTVQESQRISPQDYLSKLQFL